MKCFTHRQTDALATCKHCCRALCEDCLTEVDGVSSCRGACAEHVAAFAAVILHFRRRAWSAVLFTGVLFLLLCPVCAAVGWAVADMGDLPPQTPEQRVGFEALKRLGTIMYVLAGICLVAAVPFFVAARGLRRKAASGARTP